MGWHVKYLGRVYDPVRYTCAHLVADVYMHELGIDLSHFVEPSRGIFADSAATRRAADRLEECSPVDKALVLMRNRWRRHHAGVLVGVDHLLHITSDVGYSTCIELSRAGHAGLDVTGYYCHESMVV